MVAVLRFLEENELWIYILTGLASALTLRWLLVSWHDWRNSIFGLEREIIQRRLAARLTILFLLALLVLFEFLIVSFVVPSYPNMTAFPTPTLDLLARPTVTLIAPQAGTPVATVTPSSSTGDLSTVGEPAGEGCTSGQIEWETPKSGDTISETVELKGTVNVPNLGFYKYEYSQPGQDTWTTIAAGNSPLVNGTIGFWNTTTLPTGDYLLRLVVVDNQNNFFPVCTVPVKIAKTPKAQ